MLSNNSLTKENVLESDSSVEENVDKIVKKLRVSIFNPNLTVPLTNNNSKCEQLYLEKVQLEKDTWKKLYVERKNTRRILLKQLKKRETETIDYSILDEDNKSFIKETPNFKEFVKQVKDFELQMQIFNKQKEKFIRQTTGEVEKLKQIGSVLENKLICD